MTAMYDDAPGERDPVPLPREFAWTVVDGHRAGRRCTACTDLGCPSYAAALETVGHRPRPAGR